MQFNKMKNGGGKNEKEKNTELSIKKIVKEFYDRKEDGGVIENESEKAKKVLDYIEFLKKKYERQGMPMNQKNVEALGFDVEALQRGELRSSK